MKKPPAPPLKILVSDAHEALRHGITTTLTRHKMHVVAEATSGREAVRLARQHKPHIVITDISLPRLNGLQAARQILAALPLTRIILYTAAVEEHFVEQAVRVGVHGYVLKSQPINMLPEAVQIIQEGRLYYAPLVLRHIRTGSRLPGFAETDPTGLTDREREVVQLMAEGMNNKAMATELKLSINTVKTHRDHIMSKLGLHDVASITRYAFREGIIQ